MEFESSMINYSSKGVYESTLLIETEKELNLLYLQIILPSGLPCYSYQFKKEKISDNEFLLAGLINAIQNFSTEVSSDKGGFRMLEHSEYLILLEPREKYTVALYTERFSYHLKELILRFADRVEELFVEEPNVECLEVGEINEFSKKIDKIIEELFG